MQGQVFVDRNVKTDYNKGKPAVAVDTVKTFLRGPVFLDAPQLPDSSASG